MKWFKEQELCCKCCGQLPPFARENIEALVREVLDPAREKLGTTYYIEQRVSLAAPSLLTLGHQSASTHGSRSIAALS